MPRWVEDDRFPPLTPEQLKAIWSAYQRLTKPLLVHLTLADEIMFGVVKDRDQDIQMV